jgi:putative phosphoribosyl transferase
MPEINISQSVWEPVQAFKDRQDAGLKLVEYVDPGPHENALVLALPRGGVPVAGPLADALKVPLDVVVARKLPLPDKPEAGFGAVAVDGSRLLNDRVVEKFSLQPQEIERITVQVTQEVHRRAMEYRGNDLAPEARGMEVYMVDDGLATGYTMIVAAEMIRKLNPKSITLCVPVAPWDTLMRMLPHFDEIYCLIGQHRAPFAVASCYEDFHDVSDQEVLAMLSQFSEVLSD